MNSNVRPRYKLDEHSPKPAVPTHSASTAASQSMEVAAQLTAEIQQVKQELREITTAVNELNAFVAELIKLLPDEMLNEARMNYIASHQSPGTAR